MAASITAVVVGVVVGVGAVGGVRVDAAAIWVSGALVPAREREGMRALGLSTGVCAALAKGGRVHD
jgi:hypothetical protein